MERGSASRRFGGGDCCRASGLQVCATLVMGMQVEDSYRRLRAYCAHYLMALYPCEIPALAERSFF